MTNNAKLASTVINTARDLGIDHFMICAGARNVPLISDLTSREDVHLWNHFDERAAAFFALGLAKRHGRPVAVVTTSGTAVAELLPAIIEAWYSGIPLVVISADRPVRFRGSGAPQAIEQTGIFCGYVSQILDLAYRDEYDEEINWDKPSPLHLNVCFEEPVAEPVVSAAPLKINFEPLKTAANHEEKFPPFEKPVAIIGELLETERSTVREFLKQTAIPPWFEATSGLREDPELAKNRIDFESDISKYDPREIIRIGGVPSLRFWRDLEADNSIRVINVSRTGFSGLARDRNVVTLLELPESALSDSIGYSPAFNRVQSDETLANHPESEPAIIAEISKLIPSEAAIFLGNSLPIREWNLAATREIPHPHCFANRGANGIDGEVSTFLGLSEEFDQSWGIFGDLTSLYDLNAPWVLNQLPTGKRRIVVLNNGGGRIFSRLPAMKQLDETAMAQTENHHHIKFSAWADLWGMEYLLWKNTPSEWRLPETENAIIEVQIDQTKSEAFWKDLNS